MKKVIYVLAIAIAAISCKEEAPKDYVTLKGKITNQNSDSLIIRSRTYSKKITVNPDGSFSDTLKVATGNYNIYDGSESTSIYLKNGFNINITIDTKQFDETVSYSGNGAEASNYLAKFALLQEQVFNDFSIYNLDRNAFDKKINSVFISMKSLLETTNNLDSTFISQQSKQIEGLNKYIVSNYEDKQYMETVLAKGKPSPKFVGYENNSGGKTSLDDLKGKYVYVDVWATWCGPCKAEIPYLKKVEELYHDKNIEFVSVSVDKIEDHDKWKEMIIDKELGGIQLLADNNFDSNFVQDYAIRGIPRFILIDPQGNIVSPDAPRPSSEDLKMLFNGLNL